MSALGHKKCVIFCHLTRSDKKFSYRKNSAECAWHLATADLTSDHID